MTEINETKQEEAVVYDLEDIRRILKIGRTSAYKLIRQVHKDKEPFPVIKIGTMYRVPKKAFDAWVTGNGKDT